jgi:uncharacterized protein YceH (UPF0502 family)
LPQSRLQSNVPLDFVYDICVSVQIGPVEVRVLGCLVEKEATTPEYYPLSLNALLNACNQKSNREPVMNVDEDAVRQALHVLAGLGLARSAATDGRVAKHEHRLQEAFNFHRHELALLCVLLLRGPQTPGELRGRTERLYSFDDLDAVHSALNLLIKREPPLVRVLPRQAGTKEARYMHLLSGEPEPTSREPEEVMLVDKLGVASGDEQRFARLEDSVAELRAEIAELKQQLATFQKQFQ